MANVDLASQWHFKTVFLFSCFNVVNIRKNICNPVESRKFIFSSNKQTVYSKKNSYLVFKSMTSAVFVFELKHKITNLKVMKILHIKALLCLFTVHLL